jgi:NitT/TauT family transport system ATP-binding protein
LLLDEPFSALDYQTRLEVCDDVQSIIKSEKKTALLVTHDISEAIALSDKVIVLSPRPAHVVGEHNITFGDGSPKKRRECSEFSKMFETLRRELGI